MDTTRDNDLQWQRSTYCSASSTCVEVAVLPEGGMAIRDGKNPQGPFLRFTAAEWAAFVAGVKDREFDD